MVILNAGLCAVLIFGIGGFGGVLAGVVGCTAVQVILVMMAKKDEQGLATYTRHIHLQKYYPASASPDAPRKPKY